MPGDNTNIYISNNSSFTRDLLAVLQSFGGIVDMGSNEIETRASKLVLFDSFQCNRNPLNNTSHSVQ